MKNQNPTEFEKLSANEQTVVTAYRQRRADVEEFGLTFSFNQRMHRLILCSILKAAGVTDDAVRQRFFELTAVHGLGGNASQFRKWLVAIGELEPTPESEDDGGIKP